MEEEEVWEEEEEESEDEAAAKLYSKREPNQGGLGKIALRDRIH